MEGCSGLKSFKGEEELEAYVENSYNLDRQMGEGNSFWDGDIVQVNSAMGWREEEEMGHTSGFMEMLER